MLLLKTHQQLLLAMVQALLLAVVLLLKVHQQLLLVMLQALLLAVVQALLLATAALLVVPKGVRASRTLLPYRPMLLQGSNRTVWRP